MRFRVHHDQPGKPEKPGERRQGCPGRENPGRNGEIVMEQPERLQARKQDQAKIEPEHPPLGQHTLDKRETAETVACPKPIRQAVTANRQLPRPDNASQHSENSAQSDQARRKRPGARSIPRRVRKTGTASLFPC